MSNREFVISDTHFNHKNVIEYENRPFESLEEMNETLIKNWNDTVSKQDKVYVLGDFAFGNKEYIKELLGRLKGYKILVMGNHDRRVHKQPWWWIEQGFKEAYKHPIIKEDRIVMQHEPSSIEDMERNSYFYLYGHVHSKGSQPRVTKDSACVCVEHWNYTPILIETILKISDIKNGGCKM